LRDLAEGASFAVRHRLLRPILLTAFVFNTAFLMLQAVYVPYAVAKLHLTPFGVGATLAVYGIGMVAGALLASRIAAVIRFGFLISIGPIAGFMAAIAMLATILAPTILLAGLSFFLLGAGPMIWVISTTTLRQAVTPSALLGRVSAVILMATWGARPLGAGLAALIASNGAELCLLIATFGFALQAGIILTSPVLTLARQPEMIGKAESAAAHHRSVRGVRIR
jgi:MFS family permease